MALIFQYGSNMNEERINSCERLRGDATVHGIARTVDKYDFGFTVWSKTNSCAAADIKLNRKEGEVIWGVIYKIPCWLICKETAGKRKSLDTIEGKNYQRIKIKLKELGGSEIEAMTYVAKDRKRNIKTQFCYVRHILKPIYEDYKDDIPEDYRKYIKERIIDNNEELEEKLNDFVSSGSG